MISRHVILLSLLVLKELLLSESANSEQHFLTLSAECGDDGKTTNLTLHTSEPFFGLLYSRDHPSTCKTVGEGLTATQLIIDEKKKCGLELMEKRQRNLLVAAASSDQENMVEDPEVHQVSLYVQHDEHVQQVIDEQFLVQCWPGMRQGLVSYQDGLSNFVDKTLTRSISSFSTAASMIGDDDNNDGKLQRRLLDMVPMEPMTQTPDQGGDLKPASNMKDLVTLGGGEENSIDIGTPWTYPRSMEEEVITNRPNLLKAAASGWMELINAESGETLTESVQVGTPVSLVIRLKQMGKMDTMVSTCTAHSGDDFYDLTNFLGCTEDAEILPNFKAFFNSRTGVKRLTSTFPMFKFPDLNKVVVRCTIMVCNKNCPVSKCEDRRKIDFKEVDIIDKFYLDTFAEVHDSDSGTNHHKREKMYPYKDDQIMRPLRPAEEDVSSESNYHKSQQEVEAVAASSVSKEETFNEEKDEDLLCLSPSRLALAFGILLVILLVALLASCTMWMRARSHSKRPKPSAFFTTRPPRPPGAAIVPANAPRGPFVVSRAPYIRVVQ